MVIHFTLKRALSLLRIRFLRNNQAYYFYSCFQMSKHTTPMYRPPEILDTYNNYPINEAMDVWALGCVIFLLSFREHPFEDSAKLRIINAKYNIPPDDTQYEVLHDLIRKRNN